MCLSDIAALNGVIPIKKRKVKVCWITNPVHFNGLLYSSEQGSYYECSDLMTYFKDCFGEETLQTASEAFFPAMIP